MLQYRDTGLYNRDNPTFVSTEERCAMCLIGASVLRTFDAPSRFSLGDKSSSRAANSEASGGVVSLTRQYSMFFPSYTMGRVRSKGIR